MQTKKILYTPSTDKTKQFGYFEKLWIASGAKLREKSDLPLGQLAPVSPTDVMKTKTDIHHISVNAFTNR